MSNEPFEITAPDLAARMQSESPPVLIDVREPWELEIAAVEGALSIPLGQITSRAGEIPRDRPVAVMCHHGGRSGQATGWLRSQGFDNAMNVVGGIDAWAKLVDPKVPRY
jgi:rhodanese-related sulfurtransferase